MTSAAVPDASSPRLRPFALKLGTLALLLLAPLGWLALAPAGDEATHPFNQDRNAVWLEHRWLERAHDVREMENLLSALHARGVGYVYPHVIPFDRAGNLPPHDREQMRRFLEVAGRAAPGMKVLPWVGGLRVGYKRTRVGTVDLADLAQRQRIVAECRGLMDEGFHGIHLNVEPVNDGNDDFLALLRSLRTAVGDGILSLSAIKPGPVHVPLAPNFFWTPDYYGRVGAEADQVVVMAYDTGIPTPSLYRRYLAYTAETVSSALHGSGSRARVLVGVPTYPGAGIMHRTGVENAENALAGIVAGLRGLGAGGTFEGVALYAEWTTDAEEWLTYDRVWRRKTAGAATLPRPRPGARPAGTSPAADPTAPARTAPGGSAPAGPASPATRR
jgi:Glycosyl hydrolases family 18